ncbi:hypothetical protein AKJ09_03932 [Labilithrix luteola]|uniref:Putative zinc-finger domain-containing protein n=1 Tax=Labilithrix luteola TaxID=1391654 RepID=A0A0K1PUR3_9BACT|nr:zf-HC2 domain-containing protein [Labilithrix luteola]AKU97268.1 hypothetical protein AKJ09_03932 [Labilithrix luteola]
MNGCTGVPISWLRLERHALGELDEASRTEIEAHLSSCPACTACLARIRADGRELPPLVVPATAKTKSNVTVLRRASAIAGTLAAAAVLVLAITKLPRDVAGAGGTRVKGNNVAFSLVREDERRVEEGGAHYQNGERFKALVTCPPGMRASFDLVVFEHDEASFPLDPQTPRMELECGNDVPLPGAFRVTGTAPLEVCLVWSDEGPVEREKIVQKGRIFPDAGSCMELAPSP